MMVDVAAKANSHGAKRQECPAQTRHAVELPAWRNRCHLPMSISYQV
jgi:hypothetical protein